MFANIIYKFVKWEANRVQFVSIEMLDRLDVIIEKGGRRDLGR